VVVGIDLVAGSLTCMDSSERRARAGSFGAAAEVYERGRPSYPTEAVDWLVPGTARRVLDLGAGTGKLTRQLSGRGLDVVAVDPSEGMRDELAKAVPTVAASAGSAEDIPLAEASVDAVVVAQAWHWVDPGRAIPEIARVLAPGGQLGLVWNIRDDNVDWVTRLNRIMHVHGNPLADGLGVHSITAPFGPVEQHTVEWHYHLTREQLFDLVTSRSYAITLPADDRSALVAQVRTLLDSHPALAGATEIEMPYLTRCFRARLP
jgi:SAM-dependent methyltransferase